jgi:hypothetical protein
LTDSFDELDKIEERVRESLAKRRISEKDWSSSSPGRSRMSS